MAFGLLANGEDLQRLVRIRDRAGHPDREGNRVGPEGHAADRVDLEAFFLNPLAHRGPAELADQVRAEGIERGDAAIDVEVAFLAGGEGEGSGADGLFEEDRFQRGGGVGHGGMQG